MCDLIPKTWFQYKKLQNIAENNMPVTSPTKHFLCPTNI